MEWEEWEEWERRCCAPQGPQVAQPHMWPNVHSAFLTCRMHAPHPSPPQPLTCWTLDTRGARCHLKLVLPLEPALRAMVLQPLEAAPAPALASAPPPHLDAPLTAQPCHLGHNPLQVVLHPGWMEATAAHACVLMLRRRPSGRLPYCGHPPPCTTAREWMKRARLRLASCRELCVQQVLTWWPRPRHLCVRLPGGCEECSRGMGA